MGFQQAPFTNMRFEEGSRICLGASAFRSGPYILSNSLTFVTRLEHASTPKQRSIHGGNTTQETSTNKLVLKGSAVDSTPLPQKAARASRAGAFRGAGFARGLPVPPRASVSAYHSADLGMSFLLYVFWLSRKHREGFFRAEPLDKLHRAKLHRAKLHRAKLHRAKLHRAKLHRAKLHRAKLHRAKLHRAKLHRAKLHRAKLHRAKLHRAKLHRAKLHRAKLHGAKLHRAKLHRAKLHRAKLHRAKLHRAKLHRARLHRAKLHRAKLHRAKLHRAKLHRAKVR